MDWALFARGLVVGFAIAAPVGPIGLLCIQRTLAQGRLVGLATGLGAASADAIYGLIGRSFRSWQFLLALVSHPLAVEWMQPPWWQAFLSGRRYGGSC